jgi:uncharacterized protein (TIGR03083 family)
MGPGTVTMKAVQQSDMETDGYLASLRADGTSLSAAARGAPSAPVPSCPEWDMTALVGHTSAVHHWVTHIMRTRATERPAKRFADDVPAEPAAVLSWYDDGLVTLLEVLARVDPAESVWNWFDGKPAPASFWHRRMAHETAVHRWDAQQAAGDPQPIDATLAIDGIDEYLGFLTGGFSDGPIEGLAGSLHLHATDCEGEWLVALAPDHLEHRRGHEKADAAIRASASDLFLWIVNRLAAGSSRLEVFGDRALVDRWRQLEF